MTIPCTSAYVLICIKKMYSGLMDRKRQRESKNVSTQDLIFQFQRLLTVVGVVPSRSRSFFCLGAAPGSLEGEGWPYGYSLESAEGQKHCLPSWISLIAGHVCSSLNFHAAQLVCEVCVCIGSVVHCLSE